MKRVTIKDIARYLTLSTSTVSRALIGDSNIRDETKQKVLKAAEELGYKPNLVAKNLKAGLSNAIGVIVPEMVTPYASEVLNGIREVLYPEGIKVIVADSAEDPVKELDNINLMERFMVDGIIIALSDYKANRNEICRLLQKGLPMIFYDRIPEGIDAPKVVVDDYMKSFFLVERLIRSGRRNIVHIAGPDCIYNSLERQKGFAEAMRKFECNTPRQIPQFIGITYDDGIRAADYILDNDIPCDAIFAFTDIVAIGAMNRLRERGKRIPEDIAVASFSGTELARMVYPSLTTVQPPLREMGRTAAELILERIADPNAPVRSITLNAEIIVRQSAL